MQKRVLLLFGLVLYLGLVASEYTPPTDEEITKMQGIELTSDTFSNTLKRSSTLLVQFHSASKNTITKYS
jgi:hypothetical protein